MARLIVAALRSRAPAAYLDVVIAALNGSGRDRDAVAATYMRELYRMGEIEMLMCLRAQWLGLRP